MAARLPRSRTPVPGSLHLRRYNQPGDHARAQQLLPRQPDWRAMNNAIGAHLIGDVVILVRMPMSWEPGTEDRARCDFRGHDDDFAIPGGAISSVSLRASNPVRKDDFGRVGPSLSTILTILLRAGAWIGTNLRTWRWRRRRRACRRRCRSGGIGALNTIACFSHSRLNGGFRLLSLRRSGKSCADDN